MNGEIYEYMHIRIAFVGLCIIYSDKSQAYFDEPPLPLSWAVRIVQY